MNKVSQLEERKSLLLEEVVRVLLMIDKSTSYLALVPPPGGGGVERALTIDKSTSYFALQAIKYKVHSVCGLENIWQMHPTWGMVQACVGQNW